MSAIRCMSGNWTGPGSTIECVLPAGRSRSVRRAAGTRVTVADGLRPQRPWLTSPRRAHGGPRPTGKAGLTACRPEPPPLAVQAQRRGCWRSAAKTWLGKSATAIGAGLLHVAACQAALLTLGDRDPA